MRHGTRSITVNKGQLLEAMLANRERHEEEYQEARAKYREKVQAELAARLKQVAAGEPINLNFNLPQPQSFTEQYDDAIAMFEWETKDEMELEESDFQRYVLNKWEWANQFAIATQSYLA